MAQMWGSRPTPKAKGPKKDNRKRIAAARKQKKASNSARVAAARLKKSGRGASKKR